MRLQIGTEWLDKCQKLGANELSDGLKGVRKIRAQTALKYKIKKHPWEKRLDKLVDKYIVENG